MRDGLYKISFKTGLGTGSGVITLRSGRLTGGDGASYYVGSYGLDGDCFVAEVLVDRHTFTAGLRPVFGVEHVRIRLEGVGVGDEAVMRGSSPDAPEVNFEAVIQRLAD